MKANDGFSGTRSTNASPGLTAAARDGIRVHLVSLGCPKNLVDSEMILGRLGVEGFSITTDSEDADVLVVNTCGFVESAKEESIQTILEACQLKEESETPKKVVVAGCLGQRYGSELRDEIPELDAIVGLGEYADLGSALRGLFVAGTGAVGELEQRYFKVTDPTKACHAEVGRFRLTPKHYGYLRISEGCDNPCTFCAIPAIRGRFRSKPIEALLAEARELVESGARELILISQDTTSYGVDLDGRFQLARLLRELSAVDGVEWIRTLYAYPAFFTDEMIDAIAGTERVLSYVDMPLQHISNRMLRRMGRRLMETKTRALLERMRERIPGLYLRTTFLVGFPGETDRDFETLRDFARDFRFERLGVFTYSSEEGTPSASFADPVPEELAAERMEELMLTQQEVAFEQNRARIGEVCEVLVDSVESLDGSTTSWRAHARSHGECPDIDPTIFVEPASGVKGARAGARASAAMPGFREIASSASPQAPRGSSSPVATAAHTGASSAGAPDAGAPSRAPEIGARLRVRITSTREYDLVAEPARPG